ncbi:ATP-binding protein [Streptomyces sp. B1866]|uniref:ATP-binding protein n=1 Tax=Streptomyces sp. B1866 TaxID=3075431 RepID=UPI0028919F84|nr:ATP-binding protein [Streptomyces sp. B1866]MDT3397792.1 ATP-binding protein [Streptomyces sp. B1866]
MPVPLTRRIAKAALLVAATAAPLVGAAGAATAAAPAPASDGPKVTGLFGPSPTKLGAQTLRKGLGGAGTQLGGGVREIGSKVLGTGPDGGGVVGAVAEGTTGGLGKLKLDESPVKLPSLGI